MPVKKAYKTQSGYKISSKKYKELSRAIENYNRRIARLEKKYAEKPMVYVPQRLQIRVEREKIGSLKELNRLIKDIESYKKEGLSLVQLGDIYITQAEKAIYEREIKKENMRREKQREKIKQEREKRSRFPTQEEVNLRELTQQPKTIERLRKNLEKARPNYQRERMNTWRQNYLRVLDDYKEKAIIVNAYTEEGAQGLERIKQLVQNINDGAFYWANMLEPDIMLEKFYKSEEFNSRVSLALTIWEDYYARQNEYL